MKKILITFYTVTIISTIIFGQEQEKEPAPRIGLLMANFINVRWYKDKEFFEEKVKDLGGIPMVRDASNNPNNQLNQAIELIDSGVKVLVVIPVDSKSSGAIISVAHKNDVTVMSYDRLMLDCDLDYYVSFNSIMVGEYMANYIVKMKPKGRYILLNGPETDNNSFLVNKGVMNVLQPYIDRGDIELVYSKFLDEWIELAAYLSIEDYFTYTRDVDAIITAGDILARGVLMSLDNWNISGKVLLTGQNGDLQAIQDILAGRQTMTVYKSLKTLGEKAAEIAFQLALKDKTLTWPEKVYNGKKEVPSVLFDPVVVDKNNIRETVIADGHLTEEEVFSH
jgi:D-xylose transport system substrate-binding protein